MTQNDLSYLQTNTRVHDFMCLAYLHEGICTHTRELPKDNINEFSHQDRFCSMMQELDAAQGTPRTEEIGKWVRELAGRILKKTLRTCITAGNPHGPKHKNISSPIPMTHPNYQPIRN